MASVLPTSNTGAVKTGVSSVNMGDIGITSDCIIIASSSSSYPTISNAEIIASQRTVSMRDGAHHECNNFVIAKGNKYSTVSGIGTSYDDSGFVLVLYE